MWAKEGQEGRRFSRRDSNCCEPLWTTSPHGDLVALIISISGVDVSPHPHPPQETIKQISELHVQMTQKPLSTGAEEANTHFPTEPFTGLRASQCCLPCPTNTYTCVDTCTHYKTESYYTYWSLFCFSASVTVCCTHKKCIIISF